MALITCDGCKSKYDYRRGFCPKCERFTETQSGTKTVLQSLLAQVLYGGGISLVGLFIIGPVLWIVFPFTLVFMNPYLYGRKTVNWVIWYTILIMAFYTSYRTYFT